MSISQGRRQDFGSGGTSDKILKISKEILRKFKKFSIFCEHREHFE